MNTSSGNKYQFITSMAKGYAKEHGTSRVLVGGRFVEGYRNGNPCEIGKLYFAAGKLHYLPVNTFYVNFVELGKDKALSSIKTGIPVVKYGDDSYYYHREFERWLKNLSEKAFDLYFKEST